MNIHEKYILRCITIAKNGLGTTFPNPMVGCVIVYNNNIIGEGYTSAYGGNHAEVNAINNVTNKDLLTKATLYVTLEPCSHFGKTPPCSDYIIEHNIPTVVVGLTDPHDKVAGKGIQKLKDSGIVVKTGVLKKECQEHHKRFLCFQEKKRPYIILKWAETKDGFIAPNADMRSVTPEPFWITNNKSRQLVHQWRSEEHAILVGTNTALQDNPKLTIRDWDGQNPVRVVLDRSLKIPNTYNVFDDLTKTIVITEKLPFKVSKNVIYEVIDFSKNIAQQICEVLYRHKIVSIIIEGGAQTLQTFIDANLWDEARVFTGKNNFENGVLVPILKQKPVSKIHIKEDQLNVYRND